MGRLAYRADSTLGSCVALVRQPTALGPISSLASRTYTSRLLSLALCSLVFDFQRWGRTCVLY